MITIAHRLSTIRNADRVVVLDEGRIVEEGTFAQLWEGKGYFRRMLAAKAPEVERSSEPSSKDPPVALHGA